MHKLYQKQTYMLLKSQPSLQEKRQKPNKFEGRITWSLQIRWIINYTAA